MHLQLVQDESGTHKKDKLLFTGSRSQMYHGYASCICYVSKESPFKREREPGSITNTKMSHYDSEFSHKHT